MDELKNLVSLPDTEIDCSDTPELDNWNETVIDKFYRPVKQTITIRLDADVVSWLKNGGKGYQSRANAILRQVMKQQGQPRKAA
ncbi:BrnA antitoxin family protein [Trichlorobacter thiogenes]|uniref:BrnA antitoxin family protein n=1 Tax=Trichlorobacter thiogenes TaxID=115783 RepID=UPI001FCA1FB3|nr:BrnA antitoxin family protein [Trichlorobacter thiogenes]